MEPMNLYLNPKTGYWYIRFKRCAKYPNGKLRTTGTKNRDEATDIFKITKKKWHEDRLIELDGSKRVFLCDWKDEYKAMRGDLDDDTLRADDLALRLLMDVVGKKAALRAIDKAKIDKFRAVSLARVKPQSVNTYLRHIKASLNAAVELGYIEKVPKIKFAKVPKRYPATLTKKEINKILARAKKDDYQMWRIIGFALWTGCRRCEVRGARFEKISDHKITIVGKGNRQRNVPILDSVKQYIGKPRHIGPMFDQCHIDNYSKRFKAIARNSGVPKAKFHALRHSSASFMISSGVNYKAVQKIMGHQDFRTTELYIEMHDKILAKEMGKMKI